MSMKLKLRVIKVILRELIDLLLGFKTMKHLMLVSYNKVGCLHIKRFVNPKMSVIGELLGKRRWKLYIKTKLRS
jgi:hypothetical protein